MMMLIIVKWVSEVQSQESEMMRSEMRLPKRVPVIVIESRGWRWPRKRRGRPRRA